MAQTTARRKCKSPTIKIVHPSDEPDPRIQRLLDIATELRRLHEADPIYETAMTSDETGGLLDEAIRLGAFTGPRYSRLREFVCAAWQAELEEWWSLSVSPLSRDVARRKRQASGVTESQLESWLTPLRRLGREVRILWALGSKPGGLLRLADSVEACV